MSSIWQIRNSDRTALKTDINQLLDSARATDWLGDRHARVVLKPNLVVAKPAARYNLDLVDLQKDAAVTVPTAHGKYRICRPFAEHPTAGPALRRKSGAGSTASWTRNRHVRPALEIWQEP
jgi:hypothetical protein